MTLNLDSANSVMTNSRVTGAQRNWNTLLLLNVYRLFVAIGLLLLNRVESRWQPFASTDADWFLFYSAIYLLLALLFMVTIRWHWPRFIVQLNVQISSDILLITWMMTISGGVRSGLGLLLLVSLASSALVTGGRMVMFYSALAVTAVLISQLLGIWHNGLPMTDTGQAGLLGIAFFATALVSWVLVDRNRMNESLAAVRARDLQSMSEINQLVIDDMQDGVIVLDGEAQIRQANRRALKWLGGQLRTSQNTPLQLAQQWPELADYLEQWRRNPSRKFSSVALGDRGEHYLPRFIAVSNRRAMGAVLVLEDLTRIREEAQQIKLAAMGRLTANIAHEIRNPLAAISQACELMLESESSAQPRLLNIAINNIQRINTLINDVMSLNRRDRIQLTRIRLDFFVREWLDEFRHAQHLSDEVFDLILHPNSEIYFDPDHLRQILTNLALNAVRYCCQQPGSITIRVEILNQCTEIHVVDDGAGVNNEAALHLFEPFFTTAPTGTGLGLYISRELCQANKASLEYVAGEACGHFVITCQDITSQDIASHGGLC